MAAMVSLFVVPTYKAIKTLKSHWRTMKVNKLRMTATISAAVLMLIALMLVPLPMRIDVPMILEPRDATTVFVQQAGVLEEVSVGGQAPLFGEFAQGGRGVRVIVETPSDEVQRADQTTSRPLHPVGVSTLALRAFVEFQLRTHGIRVLTIKEASTSDPYLYIGVTATKLPWTSAVFAIIVDVSLRETVKLVRKPKQRVFGAATWGEAKTIGTCQSERLIDCVTRSVRQQVDQFANDYLRDNPRD